MSNTTTHKSRKKVVATAMVGGLLSLTLVGGTFANLNTSITDGADTHRIFSDEVKDWGFSYHSASGTIDADINITDSSWGFSSTSPTNQAGIIVQNDGSIPAQFAFYVDPSTAPTLDSQNPIWDETYVHVAIPTSAGDFGDEVDVWTGTARELFATAFVTGYVLNPGESTVVTVTILAPNTYTWKSVSGADAVDVSFGTMFTFNQLTTPTTSPLYLYAMANGDQRNGLLDPAMSLPFRDELTSSMTSTYTIPSADIAGLPL